jgi:hypothetical protein
MANKDSGDRNYGAFGITMVLAVLLLLLAAFFWPKTGSVWDDDATANVAGTSFYKNMECSCIGFTALRNDCRSCRK